MSRVRTLAETRSKELSKSCGIHYTSSAKSLSVDSTPKCFVAAQHLLQLKFIYQDGLKMDSRPLLVPFQSLQLDSIVRLNLGISEKKTLSDFADDDSLGHDGFSARTILLSVQMLLGH